MNKVVLASILISFPVLLFGQKKTIKAENIKSVVVYEQKFDSKGKATQLKDSETKYDSNGNVLEEIEYKDGLVDKHSSYEYDSNNNKTKETEFDVKGKASKITEYKYKGNLKIEKTVYDGNKKQKSKKTYQYETF